MTRSRNATQAVHYEYGKRYPHGTMVWLCGILRRVEIKPGTGGKGTILRKVHPQPEADYQPPQRQPERSVGYHTRDMTAR